MWWEAATHYIEGKDYIKLMHLRMQLRTWLGSWNSQGWVSRRRLLERSRISRERRVVLARVPRHEAAQGHSLHRCRCRRSCCTSGKHPPCQ